MGDLDVPGCRRRRAQAVRRALEWDVWVPDERIQSTVSNGWVTLEGEVEWQYQRERAEEAVRRVRGIKRITNAIELKPRVAPSEIKRKIEEALRRRAEIDAKRVTVETIGGEVILRGTVRSLTEREEVERAAWQAPGVTKVDNRITGENYVVPTSN